MRDTLRVDPTYYISTVNDYSKFADAVMDVVLHPASDMIVLCSMNASPKRRNVLHLEFGSIMVVS